MVMPMYYNNKNEPLQLDRTLQPQSFGNNLRKEEGSGKPTNQALAISYAAQGMRRPTHSKRFPKLEEHLRKK